MSKSKSSLWLESPSHLVKARHSGMQGYMLIFKEKKIPIQQPWFGLLYLSSHSAGPEIQSILWKCSIFTPKDLSTVV